MKQEIKSVRMILYTLFVVGGILVALALTMVLSDDEGERVKPQSQAIELSIPGTKLVNTPDGSQSTVNSESGIMPELQSSAPAESASSSLTIDISRVKPDGAAVFAGTALPNSTIRVFEGQILLGKTVADQSGEWVIVLEKLLAAGQHLISIAMEHRDGSTELADRSLAVEIYEDFETKPLVALLPETATAVPVLIQSPDDVASVTSKTAGSDFGSEAKDHHGSFISVAGSRQVNRTSSIIQTESKSDVATIAPTSIVWRDAKRILISGTSQGGIRVIVNESNGPFGEALVLVDGTWQIAGGLNLETERHHLQFTLLDEANEIIANYSLPLASRDLAKGQDGSPLVVVNKGDALWRIAYHRFGDGIRFVDIVRRNSEDIVDPDLIYPKQIFALPKSVKDKEKQN